MQLIKETLMITTTCVTQSRTCVCLLFLICDDPWIICIGWSSYVIRTHTHTHTTGSMGAAGVALGLVFILEVI